VSGFFGAMTKKLVSIVELNLAIDDIVRSVVPRAYANRKSRRVNGGGMKKL
jgi:hypothetical protein